MLKTHKYLNLKMSILSVSSLIVKELKKNNKIKYNVLYQSIKQTLNEDFQGVFLKSLTFLYALGVLIYIEEEDSLELII